MHIHLFTRTCTLLGKRSDFAALDYSYCYFDVSVWRISSSSGTLEYAALFIAVVPGPSV